MQTNFRALASVLVVAAACNRSSSETTATAPAPPAVPMAMPSNGVPTQIPNAVPPSAPGVVPGAPMGPVAPVPMPPGGNFGDIVVGSGQSLSEPRPLADFVRVSNGSSFDVHVSRGAAFSVVVTGDSNIVPLVTTTVAAGELSIASNGSFRTRVPSRVDVTLVQFAGASNAGSGAFEIDSPQNGAIALRSIGSGGLTFRGTAGPVTIDLAGSGTTTLVGSADSISGTRTGSGDLVAGAFAVRGATLRSTGSGSATLAVHGNAQFSVMGSGEIHASIDDGTADLSVVGSGSITWSGNANVTRSSAVGSGTITHQ